MLSDVEPLPPTSERLRDPSAVPYFLWDMGLTVVQARKALAGDDAALKLEVIVRLLREANTRDVWLFVDWAAIDDAWPHIEHRLGRSRAVWQMMRDHRRSLRDAAR
jgi:hypothetical protein